MRWVKGGWREQGTIRLVIRWALVLVPKKGNTKLICEGRIIAVV